jgi:hypothetical protein
VLTEFVIVAGAANQWVSKQIRDDAVGNLSFWHLFEQSWLNYNWRFAPQSNLSREWGAQLALDVATFVISGLLIFVLVRAAAATFWRVFFATWLSVLAGTLVGAFIRGLILPSFETGVPGAGRLTRAVFGPGGPGTVAVVSSATLGLLAALVAGFVAVQTRRPAGVAPAAAPGAAPYFAPQQPPAYYGEHPSGAPAAPSWQDQHFEPRGRHSVSPPPQPPVGADQPTTAYQPVSNDQSTTSYQPAAGDQPTPFYQPTPPPPAYQPGGGYQPDAAQPTTQFPRPPDEDDPHHQ